MRVVWVVLLSCAACGRSGFARIGGDAGDDSPDGSSPPGDGYVDPFDAPAGSTVVRFGETPGANVSNVTSDTYLSSESTSMNFNYGGSSSVSIEGAEKHALLRFDVSAIPASTMIVAARLHLYFTSLGNGTITISPVTEAWTEGNQTGTAGVANYTMRTATQAWTTPGGSAGSSIASMAIGPGAQGIDLPVATVAGWINTPSSNNGMLLISTGGSDLRIDASEGATASQRPELVVTYEP